MAHHALIRKANLQIADMDRHVYLDHAVTIAQHPSETDERLMVRLLALALNVSANQESSPLTFAKGLWDASEPEIWRQDLTGSVLQWIDVGQPDERRLAKASGRSQNVTVYAYSPSTALWWKGICNKVHRLHNLAVWEIPAVQTQSLTTLCQRSMLLQVTVQDGDIGVTDGTSTCEIVPILLKAGVGLRTYAGAM